jgi:hypothetical protein
MSAQPAYNSPSFHTDPVSISFQTEAINQLLAQKDCPSECRPLIDYLIGIAEGSTEWIEKNDAEVGLCARPKAEPTSRVAAQKWVQRTRKTFIEWQKKKDLALIEISPGGKDTEQNKTFDSRYKLNILKLAEETVTQAQSLSQWHRDPRRAVELAAEVIIEDTPQTKPFKPRFRSPRRDDDSLLKRNPKTALTLLKEVRNILERKGEDVGAFWQEFYEQAETVMLGTEDVSPEANGKVTPIEARRKLAEQRKAASVVHTLTEEESMDTGGHTSPPVSTPSGGMDKFVHPPTPEEEQFRQEAWNSICARIKADELPEEKRAESAEGVWTDLSTPAPDDEPLENFTGEHQELAAVDIFESVSGFDFGASLLHDPSPDGEKMRNEYEEVCAKDFRANLPRYLEMNSVEQFYQGTLERAYSLAVRPSGERHFWQIDDADEKTARLLKDVAFLIIETSPGNFQIWLALSDEVDLSDREEKEWWKEQRNRLIRRVGGNGGSYGALRWPGTFNNKPKRESEDGVRPLVQIVRANMGRVTELVELEKLNLLAPAIENPKKVVDIRPRISSTPTQWPSWERELSRSDIKANGEPDHSVADAKWCKRCFEWGWSRAEVKAMLLNVSPRAKEKTNHYVELTLDRAEEWAA